LWKSKDVLGLRDVTREEILEVLSAAKEMKQMVLGGHKKRSSLQGKTVVTLFYENSTRTKLSFELAGKYLGANVANISVGTSSVSKGESLLDTGKTIDMMGADVIAIRHGMSGAPHLLARHVKASVINAGDGMHEHPTQALLDLFTILETKGKVEGLKVAIVGDIYHSRVARSNIWGLKRLGAHVFVNAPQTMMPCHIETLGVNVSRCVQDAIEGADVVMGLRVQLERQKNGLFPSPREYGEFFGIHEEHLSLAHEDVLLLHPGPVNRGLEIQSHLVDGAHSKVHEQVLNGVAVRMALLNSLIGEGQG
jgi:aspartate carbamoyltransferase catalytic subunit